MPLWTTFGEQYDYGNSLWFIQYKWNEYEPQRVCEGQDNTSPPLQMKIRVEKLWEKMKLAQANTIKPIFTKRLLFINSLYELWLTLVWKLFRLLFYE